jgi:hypothetical protein
MAITATAPVIAASELTIRWGDLALPWTRFPCGWSRPTAWIPPGWPRSPRCSSISREHGVSVLPGPDHEQPGLLRHALVRADQDR